MEAPRDNIHVLTWNVKMLNDSIIKTVQDFQSNLTETASKIGDPPVYGNLWHSGNKEMAHKSIKFVHRDNKC